MCASRLLIGHAPLRSGGVPRFQRGAYRAQKSKNLTFLSLREPRFFAAVKQARSRVKALGLRRDSGGGENTESEPRNHRETTSVLAQRQCAGLFVSVHAVDLCVHAQLWRCLKRFNLVVRRKYNGNKSKIRIQKV